MEHEANVMKYFRKEIEQLAEKDKDAILVEVDGIISEAIAEYESDAKRQGEYLLKHRMDDANSEHAAEIAAITSAKNKKLNDKRNELAEDVFSTVKEKLIKYTKESKYIDGLLASLKEAITNYDIKEGVLSISKNDSKLLDEIKKTAGKDIEVVIGENVKIGGYILEDKKAGVVIDESYDSLLEDQKEWFYLNSGLVIE